MEYKPGDSIVLVEDYASHPKGTDFILERKHKNSSPCWWTKPFPGRPHGMCVMASRFKKLEQPMKPKQPKRGDMIRLLEDFSSKARNILIKAGEKAEFIRADSHGNVWVQYAGNHIRIYRTPFEVVSQDHPKKFEYETRGENMSGNTIRLLEDFYSESRNTIIRAGEIAEYQKTDRDGDVWVIYDGISVCIYKKPFVIVTDKNASQTVSTKREMWSFTTSSRRAVDFELIAQDCTRKKPLIFVSIAGEDEFVLVHASLIHKYGIVGIDLPSYEERTEWPTYNRFSIASIKERPRWTEWARKVRHAEWPGKEVNVAVTIPKV